jgi:hypothetical protein
MDSDDELRNAVQAGATFAQVRVVAVARDKAGTRSQTAAYECEVIRAIEGALPSPARLKHFGPPMLEAGHLYIVGAIDSRRHHAAWELRFAAAAEADSDQAAAAFLARRTALLP